MQIHSMNGYGYTVGTQCSGYREHSDTYSKLLSDDKMSIVVY